MALFNRLRFKYLLQDKIGNYSLYALGEIVLIVVGILIALQINNWNESRKAENLAHAILSGILIDLDGDYRRLQAVIDFQLKKREKLERIVKLAAGENRSNEPKIDRLYAEISASNVTFFPSIGAYRSAVTSGNIDSVSNLALKHTITSLYEHYYYRLVYNGKIYDERADKVSWEERLTFYKLEEQIDSLEDIRSAHFSADAKYLLTNNQNYITRANQTLKTLQVVRKMIRSDIGHEDR